MTMSNKIAVITDTHHGIRNSSRVFREMQIEWYEQEFFPYLKQHNISKVIHLGDFFDSRTSLTLNDLDSTINQFLPLLNQYKVDMVVIAGNHDVAYRNTNRVNSLSVIKQHERVQVIEDHVELIKTSGKTFVLCPWLNDENEESHLEQLKFYANDDHILGMHGEFKDMRMYANSKLCEHGLDVNQFKKFHKVVSGHFHHPSINGNLEYLGAAFHFNWQDHGDWRGFHVYHADKNEWEPVENTNCLFEKFNWYDGLGDEFDDQQIKELVSGKIVRIQADEEYDKVKLKDFVNRCEQHNPVSVDVIDNTILESYMLNEDDSEEQDTQQKDLSEYVDEALEQHSQKDQLTQLFEDIRSEAASQMVEFE